jgi:hypothetical protein
MLDLVFRVTQAECVALANHVVMAAHAHATLSILSESTKYASTCVRDRLLSFSLALALRARTSSPPTVRKLLPTGRARSHPTLPTQCPTPPPPLVARQVGETRATRLRRGPAQAGQTSAAAGTRLLTDRQTQTGCDLLIKDTLAVSARLARERPFC